MFTVAAADCSETRTDPYGILTSPVDPSTGDYRRQDACVYFINVHNARQVTFFITDFISEDSKDVLEYGVGYDADTLLSRGIFQGDLTGALPAAITIDVTGEPLWFLWTTDNNTEFKGWELHYVTGMYVMCIGPISSALN